MSVSWIGGKRKSAAKTPILKTQRDFFARQKQQKSRNNAHNVFQEYNSTNDKPTLFQCNDQNAETDFLKRKKLLLHQRDWVSIPDAPSFRKHTRRSPIAMVPSICSPSARKHSQSPFTPLFSNDVDLEALVETSKSDATSARGRESENSHSLTSNNYDGTYSVSAQSVKGRDLAPRKTGTGNDSTIDTTAWTKQVPSPLNNNGPPHFPDFCSPWQNLHVITAESVNNEAIRQKDSRSPNGRSECKPSHCDSSPISGNLNQISNEVDSETLVSRLERACSPLPNANKDSNPGTTFIEPGRVMYTRPQHWPWHTNPVADNEDDEIQEWE